MIYIMTPAKYNISSSVERTPKIWVSTELCTQAIRDLCAQMCPEPFEICQVSEIEHSNALTKVCQEEAASHHNWTRV